ncbi:cbb3-type cytochrome c oxidase subunit I [Shigella flexneri]
MILVNVSLGVANLRSRLAAYPPLSGIEFSPGVGVDYWIWSLQLSSIGTTLTGINFFVTILKMRAPGMTMFKMPVFTWASLCATYDYCFLPNSDGYRRVVTLNRYLGHPFLYQRIVGNVMMYINLISAWATRKFTSSSCLFSVCSPKLRRPSRVNVYFGYTSLVWATVCITVLSFIVWLHHFFTSGCAANVNAFFGIATMIIAIPTG